jgi:hypothetical protein
MFYGDQVRDTRQLFFLSWEKYCNQHPLLPLEQQIAAVIAEHPEYHHLFQAPHAAEEAAYFPELGQTNPFLHMGLHLAVRDQINLDRPKGICPIFQALAKKGGHLEAEHQLMERLAESLWVAQRNASMPDEMAYLLACQGLLV